MVRPRGCLGGEGSLGWVLLPKTPAPPRPTHSLPRTVLPHPTPPRNSLGCWSTTLQERKVFGQHPLPARPNEVNQLNTFLTGARGTLLPSFLTGSALVLSLILRKFSKKPFCPMIIKHYETSPLVNSSAGCVEEEEQDVEEGHQHSFRGGDCAAWASVGLQGPRVFAWGEEGVVSTEVVWLHLLHAGWWQGL